MICSLNLTLQSLIVNAWQNFNIKKKTKKNKKPFYVCISAPSTRDQVLWTFSVIPAGWSSLLPMLVIFLIISILLL